MLGGSRLLSDTAWETADDVAQPLPVETRARAADATVDRIAGMMSGRLKMVLLVRGEALRGRGLVAAGKIAAMAGARLVSDTFAPHYETLSSAAPHDFLNLTGGEIGSMMAVSTGAGIACPDRKIVTLVGDGSAMYTVQSLWTQACEQLDVVTVVYANRGYKVLTNGVNGINRSSSPRAVDLA